MLAKENAIVDHCVGTDVSKIIRNLLKTFFQHVGGEGAGVSFSGDIQDPPGQGPLQPTVGDSASAGGLD